MNCKQGDLAVIVGAETEWDVPDIGRLVRIIEPGDDYTAEGDCRPHWAVRCVSGQALRCSDAFGENTGFDFFVDVVDALMKPIRDPGDDATDETLEWLPLPTQEHA